MKNKKYFLVLAAVILSGDVTAQVPGTEQVEWQVMERGYVTVRHHPRESKVAVRVLNAMSDNFERVSNAVGYTGAMRANVLIAGSEEEFRRETGGALPSWGEASMDYGKGLIVLKSPSFSGAQLSELENAAVHELVHLLVGATCTPSLIPRWFNEGTAVYLSKREGFRAKVRISKALFFDSLIQLGEIAEVLSFERERASLAYAESRAAVDFMQSMTGKDGISQILLQTELNKSFDKAFIDVTGIDPLDFEIGLRKHWRDNYRIYFLAAAEDYIWFIIPGLFIFAYLAVKWRNRKIIRKWEIESEGNDNIA